MGTQASPVGTPSSPPPTRRLRIVTEAAQARSVLDPLRSNILSRLRTPGSASSVADELALPRQRVNYHVRTLEDEGLLVHIEDRRKGNCVERVVQATAERYLIDPRLFESDAVGRKGPRPKVSFAADDLAESATRTLRDLAALLQPPAPEPSDPLPVMALEASIRFASPDAERAFAGAMRDVLDRMIQVYDTNTDTEHARNFRITVGGYPSPESD